MEGQGKVARQQRRGHVVEGVALAAQLWASCRTGSKKMAMVSLPRLMSKQDTRRGLQVSQVPALMPTQEAKIPVDGQTPWDPRC